MTNLSRLTIVASTFVAALLTAGAAQGLPVPGRRIISPAGEVSYWAFDQNANDPVGGRDGILIGNAAYSTDTPPVLAGFSTHSLMLDGNIDKMFYDVPVGDSLTGEFTVALWLKNLKNEYSAFIGTRSPVEGGFDAKFNRLDQRVYTDIGDMTSVRETYSTPGSVPLNEWHHVAIAVKPGVQTVFVDGNPIDFHNFPANFTPVLFNANHDIAIGAIHGNSNDEDYQGLVDDVRIFRRVLSPEEVQSIITVVPEPASAVLAAGTAFAAAVAARRSCSRRCRTRAAVSCAAFQRPACLLLATTARPVYD